MSKFIITILAGAAAASTGLHSLCFAADATMPLAPRQSLVKDRKYFASSGAHYLVLQPDGNLVVYNSANKKVWGLDQAVPNVKAAAMKVEPDGNFVAYGPGNKYLWSAVTKNPDPRAWVDLTPSGALQLVSDRQGVMWSSDGKTAPAFNRGAACQPYEPWAQCVALASPKMRIMATKAVTPSAMAAVKQIYTDMSSRFKPAYPKNKFDGFIVYMTNGEPWSQLNGMGPIGPDLGANNSGDELRGGAAEDYVWLSEQMICKTGVKTRGDKDKTTRTFDQVVHEFGHSIDKNFGLTARIQKLHANSKQPAEEFAWDVQHWFSAPAGNMAPPEKAFLGEIFTAQKTFSCNTYSAAPATPSLPAAGTYMWTNDGKNVGIVTLNPNGTCLNVNGSFRQTGVWKVTDAAKRELNLNWNNGTFIDTLVLSADSKQLEGKNQKGNEVKGVRR